MSSLARSLSIGGGQLRMGVTVKRMNRAARFAVAIGVGLTAVEAQAGSVTVTFGALPNSAMLLVGFAGLARARVRFRGAIREPRRAGLGRKAGSRL